MKWPIRRKPKQGMKDDGKFHPAPRECDHKWTDIRIDGEECWYLEYLWSRTDSQMTYSIYEPYVCIHCKQRKDILLFNTTAALNGPGYLQEEEVAKILKDLRKKYPQIKDRPIVEDAVSDLQMVDREYLKIAATVMGVKL